MSAGSGAVERIAAALPAPLHARSPGPDDEPAVRALHATALPPGLGDGPLAALQLVAQRQGFRAAFPDGDELLVERSGRVVARLLLGRELDALRIVDVVVDEAARRTGVGRAVVRAVQDAARSEELALRLSVVRGETAAEALYAGTGFGPDDDAAPDPVRVALVWRAGGAPDRR